MFTRQRSLDWSCGLRDLSRPTISAEARRAHCRASAWANCAELSARRSGACLVVAGRFDRSAIMRIALASARARQGVSGEPWALCIADALRGTWALARRQRPASRH